MIEKISKYKEEQKMSDHLKIELKMYLKSIIFGLILLFIASLYLYARRWNFDLFIVNKAIATTSILLIGLSMALSGICHFWNFADTKLAYRKQLGVAGFGFGLVHYILSVGFLSGRFKLDWIINSKPAIWLAEVALVFFLVMALLSLFEMSIVKKFGSAAWHKFLRYAGYTALLLTTYHLIALKYKMWLKWFQEPDSFLPPLSLIAAILIIFILILRVALLIANLNKNRT